MFTQKRNKVKIFYANYLGYKPVVNEQGYETGANEAMYTEPQEFWTHVSPNRGRRDEWQFGDNLNYDKLIFDTKVPFDEKSILWVDQLDTTKPHDYTVSRVAKSLSHVHVAIERIDLRDV